MYALLYISHFFSFSYETLFQSFCTLQFQSQSSTMGIRFSSFRSNQTGSTLGELPESCVASIIGYMDPPQICQLATLNRAFRAASSADFVWESKLPTNYHLLLAKIFHDFPINLSKRDIYASLCRLNTIDDGTKVITLLITFINFVYLQKP